MILMLQIFSVCVIREIRRRWFAVDREVTNYRRDWRAAVQQNEQPEFQGKDKRWLLVRGCVLPIQRGGREPKRAWSILHRYRKTVQFQPLFVQWGRYTLCGAWTRVFSNFFQNELIIVGHFISCVVVVKWPISFLP